MLELVGVIRRCSKKFQYCGKSSESLTEDENLLLRQTLGMGCKQRSVKSLAQQMGTTQNVIELIGLYIFLIQK